MDWLATVNRLDEEKVGASEFSLFPIPPAADGVIGATGLVDVGSLEGGGGVQRSKCCCSACPCIDSTL